MEQRGEARREALPWCVWAAMTAAMFAWCALACAASVAAAGPDAATCRVVFVGDDDVLNVRSEPGASSSVVGTLPPTARDVRITGAPRMVGGSAWLPVEAGGLRGWALGRHLTEDIAPESFCAAPPAPLLETLLRALRTRDGALLASLVHEERGVRVHVDWWNEGVRLARRDVERLFTDAVNIRWGEDPNGVPEEGSFTSSVLPSLERDMLGATEVACNTMNLAGVSDTMMFPTGCVGINYYSYFRMPTAEENELDWGAWVVGIERWEGRLIIGYLAHYRWEP